MAKCDGVRVVVYGKCDGVRVHIPVSYMLVYVGMCLFTSDLALLLWQVALIAWI